MDERTIRQHAREVARDIFENLAVGHHEEITAEWLMQMHPSLNAEEAEEYRLFCKRSTITFKGCYGDGSIMWPKWNAFKAEIASL